MPNIRPITDLRKYNDVLNDVSQGSPVYLTRNGRGEYAVLEMNEYDNLRESLRLMNAIAEGIASGEEEGWLSLEETQKKVFEE